MNLSLSEHLESIDHLLTTTRVVRKRLDLTRAVDPATIEQCLEIAVQAPTGSNSQGWHFVVITDQEKRARIAEWYRMSFEAYRGTRAEPKDEPQGVDAHADQMRRVISSSRYLADHMHEVPVLILACIKGRAETKSPADQAGLYGSILPAAWSLMLALRARGLGAAWTTLHIKYEREVAELLGLPDNITQAVLLPVAYFTGEDFKPAKRSSIVDRTHWDTWGQHK